MKIQKYKMDKPVKINLIAPIQFSKHGKFHRFAHSQN